MTVQNLSSRATFCKAAFECFGGVSGDVGAVTLGRGDALRASFYTRRSKPQAPVMPLAS